MAGNGKDPYYWGIYRDWLKSTMWANAERLLLPLLLDGQHGIDLLLHLESVPLGDGSPRVGQHVWPVSQLGAGAVVAHKDLADGIVLANLVIVQNSYHHLHFLKEDTHKKKCTRVSQPYRSSPGDTQRFRGSWGVTTEDSIPNHQKEA